MDSPVSASTPNLEHVATGSLAWGGGLVIIGPLSFFFFIFAFILRWLLTNTGEAVTPVLVRNGGERWRPLRGSSLLLVWDSAGGAAEAPLFGRFGDTVWQAVEQRGICCGYSSPAGQVRSVCTSTDTVCLATGSVTVGRRWRRRGTRRYHLRRGKAADRQSVPLNYNLPCLREGEVSLCFHLLYFFSWSHTGHFLEEAMCGIEQLVHFTAFLQPCTVCLPPQRQQTISDLQNLLPCPNFWQLKHLKGFGT